MAPQSIYSPLYSLTPILTPHLHLLAITAFLTPLLLYPFTLPTQGPLLANLSACSQLIFHLFASLFTLTAGHDSYSPFNTHTYIAISLSLLTHDLSSTLTTHLTTHLITLPTPHDLKSTAKNTILHLIPLAALFSLPHLWLTALTLPLMLWVFYHNNPNRTNRLYLMLKQALVDIIWKYATLPMRRRVTRTVVGYLAAFLMFVISQAAFVMQVLCFLSSWWGEDNNPEELFSWLNLGFWVVLPVIGLPLGEVGSRLEEEEEEDAHEE